MPINTNSCFCDMKTVQTTDLTFKVLPKKEPEALNKDIKKTHKCTFPLGFGTNSKAQLYSFTVRGSYSSAQLDQ